MTRFDVWRQRQSPTWVLNRDLMLARPSAFDSLWVPCTAEAAIQHVATFPTTLAEAGTWVEFNLPDSLSLGWWYYVTAGDSSGNVGCLGMGLWR